MGRRFGVKLLAQEADEVPQVSGRPPDATFPVCLFCLRVNDGVETKGYYGWMLEPVVTKTGEPRLKAHETAQFKRLNRKALDEIVSKVNRWYDVLVTNVAE